MSERVTVEETAKILGIGINAVRIQMRRGYLPIGEVIPPVEGCKNYQYLIYRERLNKFIGKDTK